MPADSDTIALYDAGILAVLATVEGLKVYGHEPRDLDRLPAAAIDVPRLTRVPVDEPENQLGSASWTLVWPLRLYVDFGNLGPAQASSAAKALLGQVVGAFDTYRHLEVGSAPPPGIQDARVESAVPARWNDGEGQSRELAGFECELAVLAEIT
jgi:hypothetical protein